MNTAPQSNRHWLALINFMVLVPLVYFIPDFVSDYLPDNKFLNVVVAVGIIVPIISYIVMPQAMKRLPVENSDG